MASYAALAVQLNGSAVVWCVAVTFLQKVRYSVHRGPLQDPVLNQMKSAKDVNPIKVYPITDHEGPEGE